MLGIGSVPDDVTWIGRRCELDAVTTAVAGLVDGRGQAILVEGEPGIGKTHLAGIIAAQAAASSCQVMRGTADQLTTGFPLRVLLDSVGLSRPPAGGPSISDGADRTQPESVRQWALPDPVLVLTERILAAVDELCVIAPTVLVVDDLQWADKASIAAWARLVSVTTQAPLLLVGTCRSTTDWPERSQLRDVLERHGGTTLELQALSATEAGELASRLAGHIVGPRLTEAIAAAGGNPLYVREVVDAVRRAGSLALDGEIVDISDTETRPVASLSGVITDRVNGLTADTREMLRLASMLGHGFVVSDLAAVTGRSVLDLLPSFDEAVRAGVLAEHEQKLIFRHGLIRDCVYLSMPATVRAALHRHMAEALHRVATPIERVVAQLMSASESADAWVVNWLVEHGEALATRMPSVAEELITRVLERGLVRAPGRDGLEFVLAASAFSQRSFDVVTRVGRRTLTRRPPPARAAELAWMLGYSLLSTGQFPDALGVISDAMSEACPLWTNRLRALYCLGLLGSRQAEQACEQAHEVLQTLRVRPDGFAEGYAYHALSLAAWQAGRYRRAVRMVDAALDALGDLQLADLKLVLLGNRTAWSENAREAESSLQAAQTIAADLTSSSSTVNLALAAAGHLFRTGRWDDAISELDIPTAVDDPYLNRRHIRLGLAALIAARRGRLDEAATWLGHMSTTPRTDAFSQIALVYARLAQAEMLAQNDQAAELAQVMAHLLAAENVDLANIRHRWITRIVRTALRADRKELVRAGIEAAAADAEGEEDGARRTAARWCVALTDGDVTTLDTCADFYREAGYLPLFADASADAAFACAAREDSAGARSRLAAAAEVYRMLGAEHEIRRATAVLRNLGVRTGSPARTTKPTTGWEALTSTEKRVAALVADGLSNPAIATTLFLSRRTVQTHVSHIITKLGVRSRVEIAVQSTKWASA
ncbi:ATP-binding protein [Lentzea sp. NPDC055074]